MSSPQIPEVMKSIFSYIEENKEKYIDNLREVVNIPSVSALPERRDDIKKVVLLVSEKLQNLGVKVKLHDVGEQTLPDGQKLPLPPVILGTLYNDTTKPTILVYGHLDVMPAAKEDGWNTQPFELTEKDGKLYGRGSSDDKGPVLGWLHAIEAYQNTNTELPVNLKFCFEGMEECGSEGLEELLISVKDTFLSDVDYVCISDNYWLGTKKPCLTYGLRGICYFNIKITCAKMDLHSGLFGGTVREGLIDLISLLDTLVDKDGKILIPGIMADVAPLGDDEFEIYKNIDFDVEEYKKMIGTDKLLNDSKEDVLMARWRFPSLSIHGIEGAFSETGSKTVIPKEVIGKFSLRLVPNQDPAVVEKQVLEHLTKQWKLLNSWNEFSAYMVSSGKPWMTNPKNEHYKAAADATEYVYNVRPDLTREGGSIPITLVFQELTGKDDVLLLPMGCGDDGAHSQNEKINVYNYIEGTKLMAAYFHEVSKLKK